jgi:replicative DNA helicase
MNDMKSREDVEKYIISALQHDENHNIIDERGVSHIYFSPGTLRDLFRLSREYYTKYNKTLTPQVLMDKVSRTAFSIQAKANLHSNLKHIVEIETDPKDLPYYCNKLKNYLAGDILKSSFEEAIDISKEGGEEANLKALEKMQELLVKSQNLLDSECVIRITDAGEEAEMIVKEYQLDKKMHPEKYTGILSGIKEIDEAFSSPLGMGELTLFMAPPGGGKTTMMLSIADSIWRKSKKNVVYVSLEMDTLKIALKHLSNNSTVSYDHLEGASLTGVNKTNLEATFDERRELSKKAKFKYLDISTAGLISTKVLEGVIRGLLGSRVDIDVLIVDYLELLYAPEAKNEEHWIKMGHVCKFLRGLGKKYGFSTISAVQLKREAISRIRKSKDSKIDFGADDAQGSNQISGDADRIYALWIDSQDDRYIRLYTAKNRYGKKSYECALYFDAACSRIYGDTTTYDHEKVFSEAQFNDIINLSNNSDDVAPSKPAENIYQEDMDVADTEKYTDGNKDDEAEDENFDLGIKGRRL